MSVRSRAVHDWQIGSSLGLQAAPGQVARYREQIGPCCGIGVADEI